MYYKYYCIINNINIIIYNIYVVYPKVSECLNKKCPFYKEILYESVLTTIYVWC